MNAQIAQHLNIAESAITRIEEWAKVLFVIAKGIGARFVSKKVVKMMKIEDAEKIASKIAPGRTVSVIDDGRVIVRRASNEEIAKLADYGFRDGVWIDPDGTYANPPQKSLAEKYEDAIKWTGAGVHLKIEFVKELKAAGFNVARLGYGHV